MTYEKPCKCGCDLWKYSRQVGDAIISSYTHKNYLNHNKKCPCRDPIVEGYY